MCASKFSSTPTASVTSAFPVWPSSFSQRITSFFSTMPTQSFARNGRKGWCGCFKEDEPPEITYCVVDNAGALTLQTMTPTQPMPPEEELNTVFAEFLEELDLTPPNKAAMMDLPAEKKWQIYCSRKKDVENGSDLSQNPEQYIEKVRAMVDHLKGKENGSPNESDIVTYGRLLDSLKTALRTQPHSYVLRFVEMDGLIHLLDALSAMDYDTSQSSVHTSLIGCVKALMNNSTGRAHVLAHPTAINTIAESLQTENIKTKIAVLEILGASCLVPGGHKKVLDAMTHYQHFCSERTRFQGIVNDLDRSTGLYRDDVSIKTAIMSFINAVLSYGPGQENLEFRLHLRYEFLMLGIQPVINKLRKHENQTLDRHLDFFEMVRNEDEKELSRKYNIDVVDVNSATAMFDLLRCKLSHTPAYPHLLSLLQHFLLLPLDYGSHSQHWLLFDRIVQQIILQTENGEDNDVNAIEINVKEIIHLLAKEEELTEARSKAELLEKENVEIVTKLSLKEQELDRKTQEKEDMEASLQRVKERLEKETAAHLEAKQKISELEDRTSELEHRASCEQVERKRLETLLSSGSLPDDAKVVGLNRSSNEVLAKDKPCNGISTTSSASKNTPPPPPPVPGPPAPPPCAPAPPPTLPPVRTEIKNVPKPSNPLKSFNWSKLPEAKVNGTVWTELDDTKLYHSLELENIDKLFCAYQKAGTNNDGSVEDLRLVGKNKTKILSVIDGRRAQNCTILLSKLKMSDEDISKVILSMDCRDQLPLDMVEQLLKFTPTAEESALLEEHSEEIDSLARADRFLYEISKIPHYEQRLRSLHYKKRFNTWVSEIQPRVRAVMEASREVARSRRLKKLLEIVLALGNYMNRGARGNATGFRLASLNKLADTKSSAMKGTTLLHYLVEIADKKYKDVLKLEEDISHVRFASKVSIAELEKDMLQLRNNLKEVEREIEFHRVQPLLPGDRFLPVMKEFLTTATCRFSELEDLFQDMKTRFDRAVRLFGEDNSTIQPDDFFGIFDTFLSSFNEAKHDMENIRKRREEEEKRAKQEIEIKKRTMDRKQSKELNGSLLNSGHLRNGVANGKIVADKGEFDDLISALRTGDVFGEDSIAKIKRSRRSRHSPPKINRDDSRERILNSIRP
ncbi:hypothetical protein V9T40_008555 [Parthenolecanium corni]|uniref:Disheveled-associated activator of morphogenesis 1 n=1 Tax=Parthenolecanium corni TaxID=536013 RepID=A0AAN9Y795_9HEMI